MFHCIEYETIQFRFVNYAMLAIETNSARKTAN